VTSLVPAAAGSLFTKVAYASRKGHDFDFDHDDGFVVAISLRGPFVLGANVERFRTTGRWRTPTSCRHRIPSRGRNRQS